MNATCGSGPYIWKKEKTEELKSWSRATTVTKHIKQLLQEKQLCKTIKDYKTRNGMENECS